MELNIYDVIKRPVISSKSMELFKTLNKITFEVNKFANKIVIRNAVEKIWDVKVDSVCIINSPDKSKIFARRKFHSPGKKKAVITLKKGYKIEIAGFHEAMGQVGKAEEDFE
jgi:large subunit ribosomal protein L23